jgi:hypothetical protein
VPGPPSLRPSRTRRQQALTTDPAPSAISCAHAHARHELDTNDPRATPRADAASRSDRPHTRRPCTG